MYQNRQNNLLCWNQSSNVQGQSVFVGSECYVQWRHEMRAERGFIAVLLISNEVCELSGCNNVSCLVRHYTIVSYCNMTPQLRPWVLFIASSDCRCCNSCVVVVVVFCAPRLLDLISFKSSVKIFFHLLLYIFVSCCQRSVLKLLYETSKFIIFLPKYSAKTTRSILAGMHWSVLVRPEVRCRS